MEQHSATPRPFGASNFATDDMLAVRVRGVEEQLRARGLDALAEKLAAISHVLDPQPPEDRAGDP